MAIKYWFGTTSTDWGTAANWSSANTGTVPTPTTVPTITDQAYFVRDSNDCVLDTTRQVGSLLVSPMYTGTLDLGVGNLITSGNVALGGNNTFDMGAGYLRVTGDFNYRDVGTFIKGTSTLFLCGTGDIYGRDDTDDLYNISLIQYANYTLTSGDMYVSNIIHNTGTLSIADGKTLYFNSDGALYMAAGSKLAGVGTFKLLSPSSSNGLVDYHADANISIDNFEILLDAADSDFAFDAGIFNVATTYFYNYGNDNSLFSLDDGTYVFNGDLKFATLYSYNLTMDNSASVVDISVSGDFLCNAGTGNITLIDSSTGTWRVGGNIYFDPVPGVGVTAWTRNNSKLTLYGLTDQQIDPADTSFDLGNIHINKPYSGDVLITNANCTLQSCNIKENLILADASELIAWTGTDFVNTIGGSLTGLGDSLNLGSGTWKIGGNFDWQNSTAFNPGAATVICTNSGDLTGKLNSSLYQLEVEQAGRAYVTNSQWSISHKMNLRGPLYINSGATISGQADCDVVLASYGGFRGDGTFTFDYPNSGISSIDSHSYTDINTLIFNKPAATCGFPAGTYGGYGSTVRFYNDGTGNYTLTPSGTYYFKGDFDVDANNTCSLTVDNSTHNPEIHLQGGLSYAEDIADQFLWTAGTGNLYIDGSVDQTLNFPNSVFEPFRISKDSGNIIFTNISGDIYSCNTSGNILVNTGIFSCSQYNPDVIVNRAKFVNCDVEMGSGTWDVYGDYDYLNVSSLNASTGTIVLHGAENYLLYNSSYHLYNCIFENNAHYHIMQSGTSSPSGTFLHLSTLSIDELDALSLDDLYMLLL